MPTYDGIGSSVTHEIEVVGDVFISNVEGGSLSTQVPFEIFSNVSGMGSPPTDSRQLRLRVQPTTEASPDDSYVTDMGIQNTTDNYFFITAPQNTSNVGDQNTFVISTTSNVGIGTTDPEKPLHVVGDSWITGTLTASNIVGASPVTISSGIVMGSGSTLTTSNLVANTGDSLLVSSNLEVGTSNLFVDTTTGRIGIGVTEPSAPLHVYNNDTNGIQLRIENANQSGRTGLGLFNAAGQNFNIQHVGGATASSNAAIIENYSTVNGGIHFYNKGDGDYIFRTTDSNNERMRISNGGNVGIGTDSPADLLEVRGGTVRSGNPGNTTNIPGLKIRMRPAAGGQTGSNYIECGQFTDIGNDGSGTDGNKFIVNNSGNVGIGTNGPIRRLDVRSGDAVGATNWITGAFGPELSAGDRVVIGNLYGKACIGAHNSGLTGWADLTINSAGGNVGIGTTNPWAGLHQYRSVALSYVINLCGGAAFNSWNTGIINLNTTNRVILLIIFTPASGQFISAIVTMSQTYPPTPTWTTFRNTSNASLYYRYDNCGSPYLGFRNGSTTQVPYMCAIVLH